mgnify:CR=1 FL=1
MLYGQLTQDIPDIGWDFYGPVLLFLVLIALAVPIWAAIGFSAIAMLWVSGALPLSLFGESLFDGIDAFALTAVPLFILTGAMFERSGVAARLVEFAQSLIGPRRGGLALVAILVCMIMGGMSGSGPADAAAVATVMLPSMVKAGYPRPFTASVIAASASTAILIPPSIAMIVYSVIIPGMDLRALFAAGMIPGLLLGIAVAVPTLILSRRNNFGAGEQPERPPFWPSLRRALPGLQWQTPQTRSPRSQDRRPRHLRQRRILHQAGRRLVRQCRQDADKPAE